MPWTGSGAFTRIYSWIADAAAGIDITASRMDTDTNNITVAGFGNCLTRDGQGAPTSNLPMNGFKHTNVQNGTAQTDYVALGQLGPTASLSPNFVAVEIGGIAVTVPQFGDIKNSALGIEGNGWRLCYGQARPQSDPFWFYMVANSLFSSWGPGYSGTSTYNMPDFRDVVLAGLDNMGGSSRGLLTSAVAGFNPQVLLNAGGSQLAQRDTITLGGSVTASSAVTDPGHAHNYSTPTSAVDITAGAVPASTYPTSTQVTQSSTTGISVATTITNTMTASSGLTGTSQNVQPTCIVAVMMYVGA